MCRPPELLLGGQRYRGEVDIWSAGCIFFEMLAGAVLRLVQELRAQHFPLYPPPMYAGKPLFTGDKEPSMVLNITQLLGPLDWEETTVESEDGTPFKHMAARDLKRLRCCASVPCPS